MSNHEDYDKMLLEKINGYDERYVGTDAAFKPSGYFRVYVDINDPIHKGKNGKINGIDTTLPKNELGGNLGFVNAEGNPSNGEKAEAYDGFIDLDPLSPTFGIIDAKKGFKNTNLGLVFGPIGKYSAYDGDNEIYEAIKTHPNATNSLKIEMMKVHKWADIHGKDHKDIENKLRKNNPFLADVYATINEKGLVPEVQGIPTIEKLEEISIEEMTTSDINDDLNSIDELLTTTNEKISNETGSKELKGTFTGIGGLENVTDVFEEAPKQFATAFGLGEGEIVSLKYPHDAVYGEPGIAGQDHIVIEQFSYQAPQSMFLQQKNDQNVSFLTGLRRNPVIKDFIGVVKMPIPNNLNFSNGVTWGGSKLNPVQAAAFFSAFGAAQTAIGEGDILAAGRELKEDLGQFIAEIQNGKLGTNAPASLALSSFLAQFGLGRAGINVDGGAALTRGTGAAINPNLELLFGGPKLRNFTFQFQFAPNDELDASIMRRIQKFFKMGMLPNRNQTDLFFLGSPNVFRLRYRTQEDTRIKGLPMHKICALTKTDINYAPDNVYQSYEDSSAGSSPVRTVMSMSFTELTPLFQDDYLPNSMEQAGDSLSAETRSSFNDIYNDAGVGSMQDISAEDTGF